MADTSLSAGTWTPELVREHLPWFGAQEGTNRYITRPRKPDNARATIPTFDGSLKSVPWQDIAIALNTGIPLIIKQADPMSCSISIPIELHQIWLTLRQILSEGAIHYWARIKVNYLDVDVDERDGDEDDDCGPFISHSVLTPERLARALSRVLSREVQLNDSMCKSISNVVAGVLGDLDHEVADVLVQVALFGEVRYG